MFVQLCKSAFFTLSIFTASLSTAYNICKSKKVDFVNPDYSIDKERFFSYLFTISKNIIPVFATSTFFNYYSIAAFDKSKHNFLKTMTTIIFYTFIVELCYYLYHRAIHTKSLYKPIHSKHHENIIVYPLDSLYFTSIDIMFYISCLHAPLLVIKMDWFEYFMALYFYVTMGFLSHSSIYFTHHVIHHKLFKYNFCLVFPYFDVLFGTYRER